MKHDDERLMHGHLEVGDSYTQCDCCFAQLDGVFCLVIPCRDETHAFCYTCLTDAVEIMKEKLDE